jgi:hypothetical protein
MLGDVKDVSSRLRAVLPLRWFADKSPNLNAILTCLATPWAWLYDQIQYTSYQARISTATDQWLDLIANDHFGISLHRKNAESDSIFRGRIQWALIQSAATRPAVSADVQHLVGTAPQVFEPANCADTGCYGTRAANSVAYGSGLAYGMMGGWGNLQLPFQFFISVQRPIMQGLASLAGYGTGNGGYGVGLIAYIDLALLPGNITDDDIKNVVCRSLPASTLAWLRII